MKIIFFSDSPLDYISQLFDEFRRVTTKVPKLCNASEFAVQQISTFINYYCKSGEIQTAEEWFQKMQQFKILPNVKTFSSLINGYCKIKNLSKAQDTFNTMIKHKIRPDVVTFNTLINGFCKSRNIEKAKECWN
jgi:pentatricopeptide repeat protein